MIPRSTPISPTENINRVRGPLAAKVDESMFSKDDDDDMVEAQAQEEITSDVTQGEIQDGAQGVQVGDVGCEECEEAVQPQSLKVPYAPSARERAEHNITHCPPRRWCDHCVKGQSKDARHVTVKGEFDESDIPRVNMDYASIK